VESLSGAPIRIEDLTSYLAWNTYMLPGKRRIAHTDSEASPATVQQSTEQLLEEGANHMVIALKRMYEYNHKYTHKS
jgi:hypothetical protein